MLGAGCSGSPVAVTPAPTGIYAGEPSSSSGPPPSTATNPDAPPPVPVLPDLARRKTTAGARAFVSHWLAVLSYTHQVRSTTELRKLATADCEVCTFLAEAIDKIHANGGQQEGGEWTAISSTILPRDSLNEMNLLVKLTVAPGVATRFRGDEEIPIEASTLTYEFQLSWLSSRWALHDMRSA
jgi:hypothetical protein